MNHQRILPLFLILSMALLTWGCNKSNSAPMANEPASIKVSGPITRVVLLYNSEACACERTRNEEAEGVIANVVMDQPEARPLERVDVAKSPSGLERYQKLTQFAVMPVLLGLNDRGQVVRKFEGFLKEPQVESILLPTL